VISHQSSSRKESDPPSGRVLYLGVVLAFALWIVIFILRPFNFWLMLSFSTALLAAVALVFGHPVISKEELSWENFLLGVLMAALLYFIFWIGNQVLILISGLYPWMLPDRAGNISAVYANRGMLSPLLVGTLLFFPVGFGEEVFWRGFIQRRFAEKWSPLISFAVTIILYVGIHLPTENPVLILAALTCGVFWGGLYWLTGRLVPVLVSHMLWDPAIFVVWPLQ
jgi:membrane protease YdiL (CAAX protease family)